MREHVDALSRALHLAPRDGRARTPRRLRPRSARATFVPLRDQSLLRGLSH